MKVLLIGVLVKGAKAANSELESATIVIERKAGDEIKPSYVNLRASGKNTETIVSKSNESGEGIVMINGILDVEDMDGLNVPVVTVNTIKSMPAGSPHTSLVYGIGNLTRDAEVRQLNDQWRVMTGSIAANRKVRGNEKTSFFNLSLFGKIGQDKKCSASNTAPYMTKGKGLSISGQLDVQIWNDRDDESKQHSAINIILDGFDFLPCAKRDEGTKEVPQYAQSSQPAALPSYVNKADTSAPVINIDEDEIPF